jgi:hypothetical protein
MKSTATSVKSWSVQAKLKVPTKCTDASEIARPALRSGSRGYHGDRPGDGVVEEGRTEMGKEADDRSELEEPRGGAE